jgi:hypothetical protein
MAISHWPSPSAADAQTHMCTVTHANMRSSVQAGCILAPEPVINQIFHE